jgi:hypothetical protein
VTDCGSSFTNSGEKSLATKPLDRFGVDIFSVDIPLITE